jgi:hypothetical protein
MRILAPLFLAVMSVSTAAQAYDATSCRTQANLAADEWVQGNIIDGAEAAQIEPAPLVIISAGRKYGVSRNTMDRETLRPRALGALITQRNRVYHEELDRCLGRFTVKIIGSNPIIVNHVVTQYPGQY